MIDELDLAFEERGVGGRHRRRRRGGGSGDSGRRGGRTMLALVLTLVIFGVLAGGGFYGYTKIKSYFGTEDYSSAGTGEVQIEVKEGETSAQIAQTLFDAGVVKSVKAFVEAANSDRRSTGIQPGTYTLHKQMKAKLALQALLDLNNKNVKRVTIPEGLTYKTTFQKLSEATGVPVADFEAAAKDPIALGVPDWWFKRNDGKQATRSVEGFLYPSTYEIGPNPTAELLLKKMIGQFMAVMQKTDFIKTAQGKDLSPFEALTVASLVQAEAGIPEDKAKVARVVYNRLNHQPPMELQFDSTANYWRSLQGLDRKHGLNNSELSDPNNPYRTYGAPGLPVGPISSPDEASLKAAVAPEPGPWLYFVLIEKSGKSAFTENYAEHERNIATAKRNGVY